MKNIYKLLLGFTLFLSGYFFNNLQNSFNEKPTLNKSIEITARLIFTQQCSENFEQYFGASQNSMFMSKEQMEVNMICSQLADRISYHISSESKPITEENVVEVVDRAIGKMKQELADRKEENEKSEKDVELIDPEMFI